jgi:pyruvate kinase
MSIKVLVTLGPSSMNREIVEMLAHKGVDLFRINLSHTKLSDLEDILKKLQSWTEVPICLDSEGAQIRNQDMVSECVHFKAGDTVKIHHQQVIGDAENISFTPQSVSRELKTGDIIRVDFNAVSLRVIEDANDYLLAIVENDGVVGSNKAADLNREIHLEALTPKDKLAFAVGLENGVRNFSLSFTNTAEDIKEVREIIGHDTNLISKIESIKGVMNLGKILPVVDEILIDRGDLSRQVPIEKIPFIQRRIISFAKSKDVPVFVATNLLESMIKVRSPTRAEVNDVASTLLMGAQGLVLAAETAIGAHPVETVGMIYSLIEQYNRWTPETSLSDIIKN